MQRLPATRGDFLERSLLSPLSLQTSFDDVPEPHCRVVVESCGVLEEYAGEDTASQPFPECPQDNHPPLGIDALLESAERLKTEFGNKRFQANRYGDAS
eukprot:gene18965-29209_t